MLVFDRSRSTKEMQALTEFNDSVSSLVVTDHEVIAGSVDGKLRTYDIRMGKLITDVIARKLFACVIIFIGVLQNLSLMYRCQTTRTAC